MRITVKLPAEDWLFAREFAYIDGMEPMYLYKRHVWERKREHEPRPQEKVPYITFDEDVMFWNHVNEPGTWLKWEWEKTKSIRLYQVMHPWKAAIFSRFTESDERRERRRSKRYFRTMKKRYKHFHYDYQDTYEDRYALLLEGTYKKAQIWIPNEWFTPKHEWFLDKIEEVSCKTITFGGTDAHWKEVRNALLNL